MSDQLPTSIVVPCCNERGAIENTVHELLALPIDGDFELIVVDDGSTDGSGEILDRLAAELPKLLLVRFDRTRGYGAALKAGVRKARGTYIVITDADSTYPNDRIPELLQKAQDAEMVVGARTGPNVTYPFIRKVPKLFLSAYCAWIADQHIPDINSGLRVFRRDLAEKFIRILPNGFSFTTTITLAMLTNEYRVIYVPIDYAARVGTSKIRPIRDTVRFLQLIFRAGIYFAPLRVFGPLIAFFFACFCASLLFDTFVKQNLTDTTIIMAILTFNTAMFATLADMIDKRSDR